MKNPVVVLTIGLMLSGFSYTSAQRCGTTEYYEMRKQTDASLQTRMEEAEKITQEWIHRTTVTLPSIPGFIPSGNHQNDLASYAIAKRNLQPGKPSDKREAAPANIEKVRQEKRKNNEFLYRKGGVK